MNVVTKKYEVIKIEKLQDFMYLITLKPEQPATVDVVPGIKPETDDEKVIVGMVKTLQKLGVVPVQILQGGEHAGSSTKPVFQDNDLEIITNKLDFNVGDVIELTIKKVGN